MRGLRRLAAFYLGCGLLTFAALVWAYWFSAEDLGWHLDTSAVRTIVAVVAVGATATLHLGSGSAMPPEPAPGDDRGSEPEAVPVTERRARG
jgi:hypothetical protein